MRDLAVSIGRYARTCVAVEGSVLSESEAGFEDLDDIVNDLDHCLYTIRVLDRDVFEQSNKQAYDKLRKTHHEGGVVTALRAIRDAATHQADVTEPDLLRAIGPLRPGRFIVFQRWRQRSELPESSFKNVDGKFVAERAYAFDRHVAGRYVLDTLFDAFHFFDIADPKLVVRDAEGQIRGFPIPPLELAAGYYRIHPDWPTHEAADDALRKLEREELPQGEWREIVGTVDAGNTLVGWTQWSGSRTAFTEELPQVAADVRRGYLYRVAIDGEPEPVALDGAILVVGRASLSDLVPDLSADPQHPWAGWAQLAAGDAAIYRRQRRG